MVGGNFGIGAALCLPITDTITITDRVGHPSAGTHPGPGVGRIRCGSLVMAWLRFKLRFKWMSSGSSTTAGDTWDVITVATAAGT